jgi:hypothetical protein
MKKSKRELDIDSFLNQLGTQEEYEYKNNIKINNLYKKYSEELEDYNYIKNIEDFNNIKTGGYIRYFDLNDNLRWGGIYLKKYNYKEFNMMLLCNSNSQAFNISFEKNTVFYKNHTTQSDKTRKLFLSYLNK